MISLVILFVKPCATEIYLPFRYACLGWMMRRTRSLVLPTGTLLPSLPAFPLCASASALDLQLVMNAAGGDFVTYTEGEVTPHPVRACNHRIYDA